MSEQERDELLLSLKYHIERTDQTLLEMKEDITVLKEDVTGLKEDVTGLKEDITDLKEDVTGLKEDVTGLKEDVRNISGSVAVMEKVHGEKIQILLDVVENTIVKNYFSKDDIDSNRERIENLEYRVSSLEQNFGVVC